VAIGVAFIALQLSRSGIAERLAVEDCSAA
jgi:hypothetical protein